MASVATDCPATFRKKSVKMTFPRGLVQPENGFRFAVDSLLLASFATSFLPKCPSGESLSEKILSQNSVRIADLGCGCGVIGFALLFSGVLCRVLGIERQKEMLSAARENRKILGFADSFSVLGADLRCVRRILPAGYFDAVVSNPPFRELGRGRQSAFAARSDARFETHGGIAEFVQAAAWLLRSRGRFFCVFLSERCDLLLTEMRKNAITPKVVLPVSAKSAESAKFVLIMGVKDGGEGMELRSPLVLYEKDGEFSSAALEFCSFLACNAKRND